MCEPTGSSYHRPSRSSVSPTRPGSAIVSSSFQYTRVSPTRLSNGWRASYPRFPNGRDMQRSLIVNADELGLTEGINEGIIEVHAKGIVTSTTMVANFWAFDHAVALSRKYPSLAI